MLMNDYIDDILNSAFKYLGYCGNNAEDNEIMSKCREYVKKNLKQQNNNLLKVAATL